MLDIVAKRAITEANTAITLRLVSDHGAITAKPKTAGRAITQPNTGEHGQRRYHTPLPLKGRGWTPTDHAALWKASQ